RKEGWKWVEIAVKFGWEERQKFGGSQSKEHAGAVICLNYSGNAEIVRGLVRPADRKAAKKAGGKAKATTSAASNRTASTHRPGDLSFAAVQRLQSEGGAIVATEVAKAPDTALKLLAAELVDNAFYDGFHAPRTWVHIGREGTGRMPFNMRREIEDIPAV